MVFTEPELPISITLVRSHAACHERYRIVSADAAATLEFWILVFGEAALAADLITA